MNSQAYTGWVMVCALDDILPATGVCALVDHKQVAIFRLPDDSLYAVENFDPISFANVLYRGMVGDLKGKKVVASPVYKQHFCLETGECLEKPEIRLQCFEVAVKDQQVWVHG